VPDARFSAPAAPAGGPAGGDPDDWQHDELLGEAPVGGLVGHRVVGINLRLHLSEERYDRPNALVAPLVRPATPSPRSGDV
jgi:hypothetical protein